MSIIIRLQNLPWAADSVDIRRYFTGLSIPEGGVHIVGGEMGDAFIAFSTDEDARLAMAKDGGKIHEMQIKLLLSSRTEMMRVIEKARQQNMALQVQPIPAPIVVPPPPKPQIEERKPPPVSSSHHRDKSPTRESSTRSRDKSPSRDSSSSRRRSPEYRREGRSRRDRSRSPRKDTDRRSDRDKSSRRDDRRYDSSSSRHHDDRYSKDSKRYPDTDSRQSRTTTNNNSESGYQSNRNSNSYYNNNSNSSSSYNYDSRNDAKEYPAFFGEKQTSSEPTIPPVIPTSNALSLPNVSNVSTYVPQQIYNSVSSTFDPKQDVGSSGDDASARRQRRSRFEPEAPENTYSQLLSKDAISYDEKTTLPLAFQSGIVPSWQPTSVPSWPDKMVASKTTDVVQSVPMDIEDSPPHVPVAFAPEPKFSQPRFERIDVPSLRQDGIMTRPYEDNKWGRPTQAFTAEVRGIPHDVRMSEIMDLFRDIPIYSSNICVQTNNQGAEKVFVRFSSKADLDEALNKKSKYIRTHRCEVLACAEAAFEAAVAASPPKPTNRSFKPKPREEDMCVQLRGLPFSCKETDIVRFFEGLKIRDLVLETAADGRCSGMAVVAFHTNLDFRTALTYNGRMIGQRYITISVSSKDFIIAARNNGNFLPQQQLDNRPPIKPVQPEVFTPPTRRDVVPAAQLAPPPRREIMPAAQLAPPPRPSLQLAPPVPTDNGGLLPPPSHVRSNNFCISLRNLPTRITNKDIADLFAEVNADVRAIHIMLHPDKTPTGDAFVEVASRRDADAALSKNGTVIYGSRIALVPISIQEMTTILEGPATTPLLQTPPVDTAPRVVPLLVKDSFEPREESRSFRGEGDHYREGNYHRSGVGDFPPERERSDYEWPPYHDRPPRGERGSFNDRAPFNDRPSRGDRVPYGSRPPFDRRSDRPSFDPRSGPPMRGGRPPLHRPMRPPFGRMRYPSRPPMAGPVDFGAPGCVVSINNLHFRAGLEELLDFFHDYHLTKDHIIRKFNDNEQPTGEARVAFQNPADAEKVVMELNRQPIMGRPLHLSIL